MEARTTGEAGRVNGSGQVAWLPNQPVEALPRDPRIDLYLRDVCEPLLLAAPPKRVRELRAELAEHLDSLVAARMELGDDANTAVEAALRQFGDAEQLATQWAKQHRGRGTSPVLLDLLVFGGMFTTTLLGAGMLTALDATFARSGAELLLAGPVLPLVVGTLWNRRVQRPDGAWGLLILACISLAVSNLLWEQGRYTPGHSGAFFAVTLHLISSLITGSGAAGLACRFLTRNTRKETPPGIRLA